MSMKYGQVPGVDKPISRIVQGVIQVDRNNEEGAMAHMDAVLETGINAVDTALIYGSDAFLGKWLASRGVRDQVVILAKGAHPNQWRNKVTPYDISADLHDTLAAMKVDFVDLYVLHRDDEEWPVEPIVDTLNKHVKEGKIKAFGGSNWTTARLAEANAYAKASGQVPFAVSSPNFSLADQIEEPWGGCISISGSKNEAERAWYLEKNMPIFAWSSMAGGFWSGRYTRENLQDTEDKVYGKLVQRCYASEDNFKRLDRVRELGAAKGATVPQIALAFLMNHPLNMFALVGSANKEELTANVAAVDITLTPQEMDYLDLKADSPA
ncbi:MAG: aldo/keto reductase [bacterium]|jgi:aryl-alcohol dehydrogenase-like predicted oxidoreductase